VTTSVVVKSVPLEKAETTAAAERVMAATEKRILIYGVLVGTKSIM